MPLQTGQILNNRYRIVKLLGEGGYGAVYKSWDLNFNMPCAVKENLETDPERQRQFEREARLLRTLRHSRLPQVIDQFTISGQGQYLVMDFIEGEDLQEKLDRSGTLPEDQVIGWMAEVCDALTYLHSQNPPIIHRDIKPANIKITPEGRAILVDFGIAKVYDPKLPTVDGARGITPGFSPPEQYGVGGTDARSDVYALGATMYACLTSQAPPESVQRSAGIELPPIRELNPSVSPQTEAAIFIAMEMTPSQRYPSAVEFKNALVAVGEELHVLPLVPAIVVQPVATPSTAPSARGKPVSEPHVAAPPVAQPRKSPWRYALLGLLGLAVLAVIMSALASGGDFWGLFGWLQSPQVNKETPLPTGVIVAKATATSPAKPTQTPTLPPAKETSPPALQVVKTALAAPSDTPLPTSTETPSPTPSLVNIGGADKIAYLDGSNIWVANFDGSQREQLTTDGTAKSNLQWVPEGDAVVYISGNCVQMAHLDGKMETIFCINNATSLGAFEISPDDQKVAISLDNQLYIVPYDLDRLTQVRKHSELSALAECPDFAPYQRNFVKYAHWSRDSKKIAAQILGVLDGGTAADIVQVFPVDICEPNPRIQSAFPPPHFKYSEYLKTRQFQNFGWDGEDLFVLNSPTRNDGFGNLNQYNQRTFQGVENINPVDGVCCYRDAQFSPDGSYLVFAFQNYLKGVNSDTQLYYIFYNPEAGGQAVPLPLPTILDPKEKPWPALRRVKSTP